MARRSRILSLSLFALAALASAGCSILPRELNLAPVWFHRTDEHGEVLEWDCLWPILHYERTEQGGDDFRIRPFYRRVTEPNVELPADDAVEHQFLWPLGRVRSYPEETSSRLWPLWSWRSRPNQDGVRDVDWYLLFPFVWGGTSADGREDYFAVLPFYADIPQFLTYDRFRALLFPLYVSVDKGGHRHHLFLWPFIGTSSCAENGHRWFRVLPFYGHDIEPGRHDRRFVFWPFFAWSSENEDAKNGPVRSYWFWPFFGWRHGPATTGWMALWPFFQSMSHEQRLYVLTLFWPIFRYHENVQADNLVQWWVWPLVGRVTSDDQNAWTFLWPLMWFRAYDDPDGRNEQQWVLPFWWRVVKTTKDGERERFVKLWPLAHDTKRTGKDGEPIRGDWSVPSPFPWRDGNAYGVEEAYGWLWQWLHGVRRGPDDTAFAVLGRLFTTRSTKTQTTASVPLLFNYEQDGSGARTLRLFQFLPIPLGRSGTAAPDPEGPAPESP
jgi:hypothetical protein